MQLTQFTDYSLRTLIYLANHPDQQATISTVTDYFKISRNHMTKVVHKLATLGYIESIRGKNGGIRLACNPAQISIGEIVRQTASNFDLVECFREDNRCLITPACLLPAIFQQAQQAFLNSLDQHTLADACDQNRLNLLVPIKRF